MCTRLVSEKTTRLDIGKRKSRARGVFRCRRPASGWKGRRLCSREIVGRSLVLPLMKSVSTPPVLLYVSTSVILYLLARILTIVLALFSQWNSASLKSTLLHGSLKEEGNDVTASDLSIDTLRNRLPSTHDLNTSACVTSTKSLLNEGNLYIWTFFILT